MHLDCEGARGARRFAKSGDQSGGGAAYARQSVNSSCHERKVYRPAATGYLLGARQLGSQPNVEIRRQTLIAGRDEELGAMNPTGLFLVDRNELFREGLKRLLAGTAFSVCGEAKNLKEAQQFLADEPAPDLIVIDLANCDDDELGRLRDLRVKLPSKIVVLTADVNLQRFIDVIRVGVQGYITKDISLEVLVQVLQLTMLGEEIFSTRLLSVMTERLSSIGRQLQGDIGTAELSSCEKEVLSFLSNGHSNKAIARTMAISEASVKIHVRDLLRKLNAKNRTQIAIWAFANGYSVTELRGDDAVPVQRLSPRRPSQCDDPCQRGNTNQGNRPQDGLEPKDTSPAYVRRAH